MVSLIMFPLAVWACAYGLQVAATGLWLKLLLFKVGSICALLGGMAALAVSMHASGFGHWITRQRVLLVAAVSVLMILSALTAEYHSLNRYDLHLVQSGPLLVLGYKAGPLYILQVSYVSALYLAAQVFFFIGVVRARGTDRLRCFFLLIGTLAPFLAENLKLTPYQGFSTTTSTIWASGMCYMLAISRFHLLEVLPVARSVLFEELGEPILILDRLGRLADSNRAARELFMPSCLKRDEAALLDATRKRFPAIERLVSSPKAAHHEIVTDGEEQGRYWQITAIPFRRGDFSLGSLIQFHDITTLKHAEETMRKAREAAEKSNRAKSHFLAMVSHELRTPLQAIIGFSDLAKEQDDAVLAAEYLSLINDASFSLLSQVNDILDFSRIEAGGMELVPARFDLHGQVRNVVKIHASQAKRKGVAFSLSIAGNVPHLVIGDSLRLRQILDNIIGNAVKFTEHGEVAASVSLDPRPGDEGGVRVRFAVRDTGIGIPENKKGTVFESFTQADPGITRRYGGSGLGASIAKRLAAMMGGDITFNSHEGKGSTFLVVIPFAMAVGPEPAVAEAGLEAACRPLAILLAEDNLFNQRLLVDTLALSGHNVSLACDGMEALELWHAGNFDLVLMDLMMPVMDGYEAARRIRAVEEREGRERTPIFAVTANADVAVRERCLEAGMNDYIAKPVTSSRLNNLLARFGAAPAVSGEGSMPLDHDEFFDSNLLGSVVKSPERAARYATLLLADLEREMDRLGEAFATGDRDAIYRAAHAIKGASLPIQGSAMSAIAEKLQSSAGNGSDELLSELFAQLRKTREQVCTKLKKVKPLP